MGYKTNLPFLVTIAIIISAQALVPSPSVPLQKNQHHTMSNFTAKANSSVPYLLPPPPLLSTTAMIRSLSGPHCQAVQVQPIQGLGTSLSIPVDARQIVGSAWMTQFMSFSLNQEREILYALLDNGFLLIASDFSVSQRSRPSEKLYHRGSKDAKDTWFTQHHQLLQLEGELFIFSKNKLEKVTIQEDFWSSVPFAEDVVTAKVSEGKLIIVKRNIVSVYSGGKTTEVRADGVKFQDYLPVGQTAFLLDLQRGLIQVNKGQERIWQIEALEYAVAVRGIENTIMVLYEYQHRSFIAEFFRGKELTLNRYYHSQPIIRDIKIGPRLAILDCVNQFVVFHHSINRHSFSTLSVTDRLFVSKGQGVSQVQILDQGLDSTFLVAFKNEIQHLSLSGLGAKQSLNTLTLQCSSNETLTESVLAKFDGPCADPSFPPQLYACSVDLPATIEFEYLHVRKADSNKHAKFIAWLSLMLVILVSMIICVSCRRRLKAVQAKCKKDYDELVRKKKARTMQMESTFNKDVYNDSKN